MGKILRQDIFTTYTVMFQGYPVTASSYKGEVLTDKAKNSIIETETKRWVLSHNGYAIAVEKD